MIKMRALGYVVAALPLALAAATAWADAAALDKFSGAKEAIMTYYAANGREGGGNCGAGHMSNIGDARVVSENADQAVVAVNYTYSASAEGGTAECSGDNSRQFTLTKSGTGWGVSGMTGQNP